jgi:hypothetical protein
MEHTNQTRELFDQYEMLNERISELVIDERILYIRENGIWEWR